jgi:hypothetical protein
MLLSIITGGLQYKRSGSVQQRGARSLAALKLTIINMMPSTACCMLYLVLSNISTPLASTTENN